MLPAGAVSSGSEAILQLSNSSSCIYPALPPKGTLDRGVPPKVCDREIRGVLAQWISAASWSSKTGWEVSSSLRNSGLFVSWTHMLPHHVIAVASLAWLMLDSQLQKSQPVFSQGKPAWRGGRGIIQGISAVRRIRT